MRILVDSLLTGHTLGGVSVSTIVVNVTGAFLLGALISTWTNRRQQNPKWNNYKIIFGTGTLGGYTTYSGFALAIAREFTLAAWGSGLLTVLLGLLAARLGWVASTAVMRSRR